MVTFSCSMINSGSQKMVSQLNNQFDGTVTDFYKRYAPEEIREAIEKCDKNQIVSEHYPYKKRLDRKSYEFLMHRLQIELAKFQYWMRSSMQRVVVVFEGRDAAGKGGVIKRVSENLNPRTAHIIALGTPTEAEKGQWYFQRYINYLPTKGNLTLFDRSWYNRAVVERVFNFCSSEDTNSFFAQVPSFEKMMTDDGISLIKIWLNVSRGEQIRRFLSRETDPLKQWKLSNIDIEGLSKWEAYSNSIRNTFEKTDLPYAPWTVVKSDDKRRAQIQVILNILSRFEYDGKDSTIFSEIDPMICAGVEIWSS